MARPKQRLIYFLLTAGIVLTVALFWAHSRFVGPGPLARDTTIIIPDGAGLKMIARKLAGRGVLSNPFIFRLGARLSGTGKDLRAGEYSFSAKISPKQVLELLKSGRTVVHKLTIAEGLTYSQIIAHIRFTRGLSGDPGPPTGEGMLLPETYYFSLNDSRQAIVRRMSEAMSKAISQLWRERTPGLPLESPREALILASMVEKETAVAEERSRIAGVFINRLRRGMRLQSDPTVAYGITLGKRPLGRPLSRTDLRSPTPYNTYMIDGLPPGPISNPGYEALAAVMRPLKTDELYFVADGSGGHVFSTTLAGHNRNVAKWRKHNIAK